MVLGGRLPKGNPTDRTRTKVEAWGQAPRRGTRYNTQTNQQSGARASRYRAFLGALMCLGFLAAARCSG